MSAPESQKLTGFVVSSQLQADVLVFSLNVQGKIFTCFGTTSAMGLYDVLAGHAVEVHGHWSGALKDYFAVERVEKINPASNEDILPPQMP